MDKTLTLTLLASMRDVERDVHEDQDRWLRDQLAKTSIRYRYA